MSLSIGNKIKLTVFGTSHGPEVGAILEGLKAGIEINYEFLKHQMNLRKAKGNLTTSRIESDEVKITSGIENGITTGEPITFVIENNNVRSKDYNTDILRPSHADYMAYLKYEGKYDMRGGGQFSGRLTAPIVAAGSVVIDYLKGLGIHVGSHLYSVHNVYDDETQNIKEAIDKWNDLDFPTNSIDKAELMKNEIIKAKEMNDSVGGIVETFVLLNNNIVGSPVFGSLESKLANYLFSIGGVKGIEFGLGFEMTGKYGSEVNDEYYIEDGEIKQYSNNNGGILGGIAGPFPVSFKTAFKPTPSIAKTQRTVDVRKKENVEYQINGRNDPAIVTRSRVVVDSLTALAIIDML